ncbi:hypothetical protein AB1Y20_005956 [Prymnesium parvum]|uniref:Uncharacterized protein n=1 Tax=Prymnesium parvum TaxID=97485 RepID=A0AB34J180_PRYPA
MMTISIRPLDTHKKTLLRCFGNCSSPPTPPPRARFPFPPATRRRAPDIDDAPAGSHSPSHSKHTALVLAMGLESRQEWCHPTYRRPVLYRPPRPLLSPLKPLPFTNPFVLSLPPLSPTVGSLGRKSKPRPKLDTVAEARVMLNSISPLLPPIPSRLGGPGLKAAHDADNQATCKATIAFDSGCHLTFVPSFAA